VKHKRNSLVFTCAGDASLCYLSVRLSVTNTVAYAEQEVIISLIGLLC